MRQVELTTTSSIFIKIGLLLHKSKGILRVPWMGAATLRRYRATTRVAPTFLTRLPSQGRSIAAPLRFANWMQQRCAYFPLTVQGQAQGLPLRLLAIPAGAATLRPYRAGRPQGSPLHFSPGPLLPSSPPPNTPPPSSRPSKPSLPG